MEWYSSYSPHPAIMNNLRLNTIRLAAMQPPTSRLRGVLLAALQITAEDKGSVDELESLFKKYKLGSKDMLSLMLFTMNNPMSGQPIANLKQALTNWWDGKLPSQLDLSPAEIGKVIQSLQHALPEIAAQSASIGKKDEGEPSKTAGMRKHANLLLLAVAANVVAQKAKSDKAAYEKHRQNSIKERDGSDTYTPPAKPFKQKWYSQSQGKDIEIEAKDCYDNAKQMNDHAYEDYSWASKKLGKKPLERKAWDDVAVSPKVWFGDVPADKATELLHAAVDANVASTVRKAITEHGEDADIKDIVEKEVSGQKDEVGKRYKAVRKEHINKGLDQKDAERLNTLVKEESDSAGFFEKMVGIVAPDWAHGKAEERAKGRADKEKTDDGSPRTYDEYVKERKGRPGAPMEREEWEARFGH